MIAVNHALWSLGRKAYTALSQLVRRQDGHAAVEFSFIAPVMILGILFSSIEVTDGVMAKKHIDRATSTLSDLVSRTRRDSGTVRISSTELRDIFIASDQIISNYGIEGATMRVTAIERNENDNGYTVIWSKQLSQGSVDMSDPSEAGYTPGATFTNLPDNRILPAAQGLVESGDHLVVAEVSYPFKSTLSKFVLDEFQMYAMEIRIPREGRQIHFCTSANQCTDDEV